MKKKKKKDRRMNIRRMKTQQKKKQKTKPFFDWVEKLLYFQCKKGHRIIFFVRFGFLQFLYHMILSSIYFHTSPHFLFFQNLFKIKPIKLIIFVIFKSNKLNKPYFLTQKIIFIFLNDNNNITSTIKKNYLF